MLGSFWILGGVLEASLGHLGEFLETTSEHLGSQLGYKHFVTSFFGSCVYLDASWGGLGRILGSLGAILGLSWNLLGAFWKLLEGILGSYWNPLLSIMAASSNRFRTKWTRPSTAEVGIRDFWAGASELEPVSWYELGFVSLGI